MPDIRAHGRRRSADEQLTRCDHGLDLVYALANKGTLDGLSDLLVRIGTASGTLLEWLENMCRFEAQASECILSSAVRPDRVDHSG